MTAALDQKNLNRTPKLWWVAAIFAFVIALYGWRYAVLGERAYVPALADSFKARPWTVFAHTLFGPLALLSGLIQFLPATRKPGRWRVHRISGRIYVVSALVVATAGLYMSFYSAGGTTSHAGFGVLALFTLYSTGRGYALIRWRKVRLHRQWMLRSYSLIFAAVTLRIWLPLLTIAFRGNFILAYQMVSWLCWVPNLIIAENMIQRGYVSSFKLGGDSDLRVLS
jgi:uncharacterized membrane protein